MTLATIAGKSYPVQLVRTAPQAPHNLSLNFPQAVNFITRA